ncbi:MAG: hypothetical protein IAF38_10240 [Bacteroidia bacterium]|nr:hypothetical protein [Bacteroidia bacterium]
MKIKTIVLLLLFYLFCQKTFSQDSAFYFSSKVLDDLNGKPVAYARIFLKGTLRSTLANENGEFSILVNKKRSVLEISAPWYFSKDMAIPTLIKPLVYVPLTPFTQKNAGIPLINPGQIVFSSKDWNVVDYDFYDSLTLILVNNQLIKQTKLLALNNKLDTLSVSPVRGNASALYKNCHGDHFLLKEESVVQLFYEEKKGVYFGKEAKIKPFEKENIGCITDDGSNTYFVLYSSPDYILNTSLDLKIRYKTVSYFSVGNEKKQRALFKNFTDEKSLKLAFGEKTHADMGMKRLPFSGNTTTEVKVNCQLIKAGKKLCMFDFLNNKIESYDSTGRLINYSMIYFTYKDNWCGEIYADNLTGKFYTCFLIPGKEYPVKTEEKDGHKIIPAYTELREIDVNMGKLTAAYRLPVEAPVQLKINDGKVFYRGTNLENKFCPLYMIDLNH